MTTYPILIVASDNEASRTIALGKSAGDPPMAFLDWDRFDRELSGLSAVSALVFEAGEPLAARRGLLEILHRAYPDVPLFTFSNSGSGCDAGELDEDLPNELNFDGHLTAPLHASTLRALVAREIRLRQLGRRHRQAVSDLREMSDRLDLLVETAKAANSLLEPRLVAQLMMSRLQELVRADSWSLYLAVEGGTGEFDVLRGDRSGRIRSFRQRDDEGLAGRVVRDRKPVVVNEEQTGDRFDPEGEGSVAGGHRSLLCIPLISRGRVIGALELASGEGEAEGRFGEKDLELVRMLMEPAAITIENGQLFRKLEELSVTDDLTHLYNSRYLNTFLGREIKRGRRYSQSVSVIFLDLDGFKIVNDTHGHLAGSRTLEEVGGLLRAQARETDIVSRYGGDEFVIVLPQTGPQEAMVLAARLRRGLEQHTFLSAMGHAVRITASFGIASFPDHGDDRDDLIAAADQAMYRVKERGKNGVEVACRMVAAAPAGGNGPENGQ